MSDPLERWLTVLGEYTGANLVARPEGWKIDGASEAWTRFFNDIAAEDEEQHPLLIARGPHGREQWLDHLRVVERAAARQLTLAPIGFTAVLPAAARRRGAKTIVRLAFGFSLSLGRRLRRSFTASVPLGAKQAIVTAGDDGLLELDPEIAALDVKGAELRKALPALLAGANDAQTTYRDDENVVAEIERLRRTYEDEVQSLATLYTINSGREARLLGMELQEQKGEDAIEAEYVARLEDLADRFRPRVLFEPLTLGIIEGWSGPAGAPR